MTTTEPPFRFLEWDSEFFGRRIARVRDSHLSSEDADRLVRLAQEDSIDCLYFLTSAGDRESARVAERVGFQLVDVRVTRERPVEGEGPDAPDGVYPSCRADLPTLCDIARTSHRDTRFYHDPHFPRERCDDLYETWISKACAGAADCVLVARREGRAVGYTTCELEDASTGRLGLVAVAEAERGHGLGERLVTGAVSWLADHRCRRVCVVTQARNERAGSLYERLGFRTTSTEHWYHLWLGAETR